MPNLTHGLTVFAQDLFSSNATQQHPLGSIGYDVAGNRYRYVKAGAADLVAGNALQAAVPIVDHQAMTAAAAAIGDLTLTMTPGATAGAAGLYNEGWATIYVTPGEGYKYRVKSQPAITASVAFTLTLYSDWPVQVALTTASKITLTQNEFSNVIQTPVTTLTGAFVGAAIFPITASQFGWIQDQGIVPGLIDGTPAVGQALSVPAAVAGGFAINSGTLDAVATTMVVGVNTKIQQIKLK